MARCAAACEEFETATAAAKSYIRWEEVPISGDRGRRIVHYYLKEALGGSDLAVVGREKSARHMSYDVTPRFRNLLPVYPSCSTSSGPSAPARFRSRREVIDWLSSFVSGTISHPPGRSFLDVIRILFLSCFPVLYAPLSQSFWICSCVGRLDTASLLSYAWFRRKDGACFLSPVIARNLDEDDSVLPSGVGAKGISSVKMCHNSKDFMWLGSDWICRKRRKHYRSFSRNGITISVHDFVLVMGEDYNRLVAYIEDLYEDIKGCNMTSVRWFHKVDEVGIPLPLDADDREIFFTPCLQELSVECIDGLTAILSAQHFKKYLSQAKTTTWEPYLCRREIDNDDVKPFDITQVEGYWNQEFLKYMYKSSSIKVRLKVSSMSKSDPVELAETQGGNSDRKPTRKHDLNTNPDEITPSRPNKLRRLDETLGDATKAANSCQTPCLPGKEAFKQKAQQQYCIGSNVEVLSQDSGIRGCWFQCTILKKHLDKIKVQYQDLQDADGSGSLEEWLPLSRVDVPDSLGIRIRGRAMVRPYPPPAMTILSGFALGSIVDAKWHDGWWEGIVTKCESEQKIHVYFPGENKSATFSPGELRFSNEWACNRWHSLKGRPELARRLCEHGRKEDSCARLEPVLSVQNAPQKQIDCSQSKNAPQEQIDCMQSKFTNSSLKSEPVKYPDNLHKRTPSPKSSRHHHLGRLKWTSYKKRSRRSPRQDSSHENSGGSSSSGTDAEEDSPIRFSFALPDSLTTEPDNCKLGGDPLFTPPLTISNLVVTR